MYAIIVNGKRITSRETYRDAEQAAARLAIAYPNITIRIVKIT